MKLFILAFEVKMYTKLNVEKTKARTINLPIAMDTKLIWSLLCKKLDNLFL